MAEPEQTTSQADRKIELEAEVKSKEIQGLIDLVEKSNIPEELFSKTERQLASLNRQFGTEGYNAAYDDAERYVDWIVNLPWTQKTQDNYDVDHAREILETTHYGLDSVKERIIEYIAVLKMQHEAEQDQERSQIVSQALKQGHVAQPVLFMVGLPGIGKTSISYTIAKALNREFVRVPFGGMGSALQLRGESRVTPEAEPGQIIRGLRRAKTNNPVILLDEVDRTAEQARAQIMGVLLELLDPEQNFEFTDYYINFPFNLSNVMFLASANNTGGISNAVLDRMELIKMPGYNDEEKITISRDYLLPKQLRISGMPADTIHFADDVWTAITRPFGYDAGIRTMERTINAVVRKVALRIAEGRGEKFEITLQNVKEFIPQY